MNNLINNLTEIPSSYLSIDIEGNGYWDTRQDIVELAIIEIEEHSIKSYSNYFFKPNFKISPIATKIHGIKNENVENRSNFLSESDNLKEIFLGKNALFHNYSTDLKLLNEKIHDFSFNNIIDTMRLSKQIVPGLKSYKLDELINYFVLKDEINIALSSLNLKDRNIPHNAPYDALSSFILLRHLLKLNKSKNVQGSLF